MKMNIDKIEARRKKMKLEQKQFAELLGIGEGMYSLMKAGKRKFSLEVVERLYWRANLKLSEIFILEEI